MRSAIFLQFILALIFLLSSCRTMQPKKEQAAKDSVETTMDSGETMPAIAAKTGDPAGTTTTIPGTEPGVIPPPIPIDDDLVGKPPVPTQDPAQKPVDPLPGVAGVPVAKVGINFEDIRPGEPTRDSDYNDVVLCFTGGFKVDGSNIVSLQDQIVKTAISAISACQHQIRIVVVHDDGTSNPPVVLDDRYTAEVDVPFKTKSRLEVYVTATSANSAFAESICQLGVEKHMHNASYASVLLDVCNTTGN